MGILHDVQRAPAAFSCLLAGGYSLESAGGRALFLGIKM